MDQSRRNVLRVMGTLGTPLLGGCAGLGATDSDDSEPTAEATDTEPTTKTNTDTPTPTDTEADTDTPTETSTPNSPDAEEIYQETITDMDVSVAVDEDQSFQERVRQAAIQGGQQGNIGYDQNGNFVGGNTHLTAAAAVANLEDFNFEDGDIAAPHLAYSTGQMPAVLLEYTTPNGERTSDLLIANGRITDERHLLERWTEPREDNDYSFWDQGPANSHILDVGAWENVIEGYEIDEVDESAQSNMIEMTSRLPYNSDEINVEITFSSWSALNEASDKVENGNAKQVFDDITAISNQERIESYAVGYDESEDKFIAEHVNEDIENPYQFLEWPREEEA